MRSLLPTASTLVHPTTVVRIILNFLDGLAFFRLISFDTLMAVMDLTSSSSTATYLSPALILFAIAEESLTACTTGAPSSGVSITTPNFPGGANISMSSSLTLAFGSR
jgi:hypothetical protein